ncbi:MAG: hypothetical protein R3F16_14285 [Myxococcota bacterium]
MKRTSSPETTRPRRSCGGNVRRDGARSGLVRDTGRRDRITRSLVACLTALATWATTASAAAAWLQVVEDFATGASSIESFPSPDDIAHEEPAGVSAATGIPTTETLGEQRTLVSLVHFTNDPSTPLLAVDVHADVFDLTNPSSTASYFQEVSYGRASISGSVQDWVSAGYADSACLVRGQTGTQQLVAALDPVIDFSQVDRWIVIIPPNPSCGFAGISSLGKWSFTTDEGTVRFSRIVLNGSSSPDLVAHELGHSLAGLQHSADLECVTAVVGTGCTELLSSDRYDTMGGTGHFSPPNKDALGWLANQVIGVSGAGGTYYLEPYETTGLGVKALRIPVRWPRDAYREVRNYYVSYRKPIGFDAIHPELATDGAMLHQDSFYPSDFYAAATGASALLDAKPNIPATPDDSADVLLEVGQSFVDSLHGITIETLGTTGGLLEISVTIDQYCGNGAIDPEAGEVCDGSLLSGETCASVGFTSGTLSCASDCSAFDPSSCGAARCGPGHVFDETSDTCTASLPGSGPVHMTVYRNAPTWSTARTSTIATTLTEARGAIIVAQNVGAQLRSIIHRMMLPFDTSSLPDGSTIVSAEIQLTNDQYWEPPRNSHPDLGDQLVLVQTTDANPSIRETTDFGSFTPVDAPAEGAPRIDVSDDITPGASISFPLNATGISWIDDEGVSTFGIRWGFDVDDIEVPGELVDVTTSIVPPDSPYLGPRLLVNYQAAPEPGFGLGVWVGGLVIGLRSGTRNQRASQFDIQKARRHACQKLHYTKFPS